MEWWKAGSSSEQALKEWGMCLRDADLRVPPDFPSLPSGPIIGPKGEIIGYRAPTPPSYRQTDVMGLAQHCMRDKGYELKRIAPNT